MYDDRDVFPDGRNSAFEAALRAVIDRSYVGQGWELAGASHASATVLADGPCPETAGLRELLEAGAGHLRVAVRAAEVQSRQAAVQARALATFASCRPSGRLDRPEAEIGAAAAASRAARPAVLTEVSEWAVDEVMAALRVSSRTAGRPLAGRPDAGRPARSTRGRGARPGGGGGAGRGGRTLAQLTAATRREVLRADAAAAARRLTAAVRDRAVRLSPDDDGMATLSAVMSGPVAAACHAALAAYADACTTLGDERSAGQRMVDCLAELILRPGINPPVQVTLTLVAPVDTMGAGQEPGEINGEPVPAELVPAELVRELAHTLGLLPRPEPAAASPETAAVAERQSPASPPVAEPTKPMTEPTAHRESVAESGEGSVPAEESAAGNLAAVFGSPATAGSALAEPPTIAVVDEISGELLALTDAAQIRRIATCERKGCRTGQEACTHDPRGPGLGPPHPSTGYAPGDRLDTFVRFRDRRCRFPGCRARAVRCDLDHNTPWPHGATRADNLCCLCHHHRLSHQAPGWSMRRLPDGGLRWTTPGGQQLTTYPPRYGTDDHPLPTPRSKSPRTLRERVLGRPRDPGEPDDDPPPF